MISLRGEEGIRIRDAGGAGIRFCRSRAMAD
jgi:hypothetical protein